MDITSDVEIGTTPEQEGVPIIEGRGEFSPLGNVPITNLLAHIVIEKTSTHNFFSVAPSGLFFYYPPPGYPVVTMFGPFAPF